MSSSFQYTPDWNLSPANAVLLNSDAEQKICNMTTGFFRQPHVKCNEFIPFIVTNRTYFSCLILPVSSIFTVQQFSRFIVNALPLFLFNFVQHFLFFHLKSDLVFWLSIILRIFLLNNFLLFVLLSTHP
jgi:hypothetical protein